MLPPSLYSFPLRPAFTVMALLYLVIGCSTTPQPPAGSHTFMVSGSALDAETARADAMAEGQRQCQQGEAHHLMLIDEALMPPAMPAADDTAALQTTTDALEAATTEGDSWRTILTLACH